MRKIQKVIIVVYLAVVATACLYVPWVYENKLMGYSFIWNPLIGHTGRWHFTDITSNVPIEDTFSYLIDFKRIIFELIIITVVFAILFILISATSQRRRIIQRITQKIFIQKIIVITYLLAVVMVCIYVPWETRLPSPNSNIPVSLGYSPIWKPLPMIYQNTPLSTYSSVDIKRVILELIAITAVFGILFALTLRPKQNEK